MSAEDPSTIVRGLSRRLKSTRILATVPWMSLDGSARKLAGRIFLDDRHESRQTLPKLKLLERRSDSLVFSPIDVITDALYVVFDT